MYTIRVLSLGLGLGLLLLIEEMGQSCESRTSIKNVYLAMWINWLLRLQLILKISLWCLELILLSLCLRIKQLEAVELINNLSAMRVSRDSMLINLRMSFSFGWLVMSAINWVLSWAAQCLLLNCSLYNWIGHFRCRWDSLMIGIRCRHHIIVRQV